MAQGKKRKGRLSKAGREAISKAATRRWASYRKAKKQGRWALARKISGFGVVLISLTIWSGAASAEDSILVEQPRTIECKASENILVAGTDGLPGTEAGNTCCCQTYSGGMCCTEAVYCGSSLPGCVCKYGER